MKFAGEFKYDDNGDRWKIEQSKTNLSSNGVTKYTTLLWSDGTASCDCPGWTQRVVDGVRSCKHTKNMMPRSPWRERTKVKVKAEPFRLGRIRDRLPERLRYPTITDFDPGIIALERELDEKAAKLKMLKTPAIAPESSAKRAPTRWAEEI